MLPAVRHDVHAEDLPMPETAGPTISVSALFAEREARQRREQEDEEQLKQKEREELDEFRKRLENFQWAEDIESAVIGRIKRAFDHGETELEVTSFPSGFCSDGGRAINNSDEPPINKPKDEAAAAEPEPDWVGTLPAGVRLIYDYWKANLKPGGFGFSARIINYKDGKPGDLGVFVTWPKTAFESQT